MNHKTKCGFGETFCLASGKCSRNCQGSSHRVSAVSKKKTTCPTGTVFCMQSGKCSKTCLTTKSNPKFFHLYSRDFHCLFNNYQYL